MYLTYLLPLEKELFKIFNIDQEIYFNDPIRKALIIGWIMHSVSMPTCQY